MTVLGLTHDFLTQNEKLMEIKNKDIDVHAKLIALIDKGALDEDFHSNREKLLKSIDKR